jgi:hypothetical protein
MDNQLFNLEKIKEITNPIENLQGDLESLSVLFNNFNETKDYFTKHLKEEEIFKQFSDITNLIKEIHNEINTISKENIRNFLILQDELIRKYKDLFKEDLKSIKLNVKNTKDIGLHLIESKKISRIVDKSSFLFSITIQQWIDLFDSLKQHSLILATVKKIEKFYNDMLNKRLKIELGRIPNNIDPKLIADYEKKFMTNPITFKEFLKKLENEPTYEDLTTKTKIIEKGKESKKIIKLKEEQLESYDIYFKLSDKDYKRKMRKQKREKLSDLAEKSNNLKEIQITDEISEKIEKFKSKFDESFDEKFLIKKDNEKDPLDLVRARKERKDKEYKEFVEKLKKKEK